jgi:murein DD-endopeptidase MepM/ murein hydrolase activator NlpD
LASHRSPSSAATATIGRRRPHASIEPDVTDVIPSTAFGCRDELRLRSTGHGHADPRHGGAFDFDSRVMHAPELDDLHDVDDLRPLRLATPAVETPDYSPARPHRPSPTADRPRRHRTDVSTAATTGRLLIAAMATGATAAAVAHATLFTGEAHASVHFLAANDVPLSTSALPAVSGMQVVAASPPLNTARINQEYAAGMAFAQERATREARLQRPLFVFPTQGIPTSNFGTRWGALHAGIDVANAIGTPILAVADGVVIDAGPVAGYGIWVKLRHADGTVTLYGHVNSTEVTTGERVMAGDLIATMGNTGNSTGPHLHFEVQLNGTERIDPVPWLAARGVQAPGFSA